MTTKTYEEYMSEINSMNIKEALANAEKCLEAFEVRDIIKQQQETIDRQQAEIERLNEFKKTVLKMKRCIGVKKEVEAEAVKEFAERLISVSHPYGDTQMVFELQIRNLVKEMVGEK